MSTKKNNSFMHGFGSILTLFPSSPLPRQGFIFRGKDIRFVTSEQYLVESWESVGDALTSAMRVLPERDSTTDEREQLTR